MRGGGLTMPGFLSPLFCQVTVLKMAIFYSNFTVVVCFLVIFVIIIIKITKFITIIIIETIIIIINKKIGHARKTSFFTSKKEDQVAQIGENVFFLLMSSLRLICYQGFTPRPASPWGKWLLRPENFQDCPAPPAQPLEKIVLPCSPEI